MDNFADDVIDFCLVTTMTDVHDRVVAQQQRYEEEVMFFLAPDDYFPEDASTAKQSASSPQEQEACVFTRSSTDDDSESQVLLYSPRPTLKELAAAKSRRSTQRKSSSSLSTSSPGNESKLSTSDDGFFTASEKVENRHQKVMRMFSEQEHQFREQFQIAAENMLVGGGDASGKTTKVNRLSSHYPPKKNAGFHHLDNVLQLMEQLAVLQDENSTLRKKCSYLEDTKDLISIQYQMQSLAHSKSKTSSILTKAGKQVMHYLTSPTSATTTSPLHSYQRVNSDVSAYTTDAIEEKPRPIIIQRSSSFGSIDDVTIRARREITERTTTTQHFEQSSYVKTSKNTPRKKQSKRFAPKWSKVKRVFGKPESGQKGDTSAVSAEELVRLNKKSAERSRPAGLLNSKSFDQGDVGSPWIVSDKLLGVEAPKSTPHSPSSIQSEPGTSFPATFGPEHDYAEIGPPSMAYVSLKNKSRNSISFYSSTSEQRSMFEHSFEERLTASDHESDGQTFDQSYPPLIRRNSSPNLSMSSLNDSNSKQFLEAPNGDRFRRSSSFKSSKTDRKHFQDRSITNPAYIQENLLSPADARQARLAASMRAEQEDMHQRARAAWIKVKDMIHTRKDSVRKRRRRTASADDTEVSPEGSSWEDRQNTRYDVEYEFPDHHYCTISREGSPKLSSITTLEAASNSPLLRRKRSRSMKVMPTHQGHSPVRGKKDSTVILPSGPLDVSSLMGGMSDDFSKKMQEWEDKKRRGLTGKETSEDISTKFTEDFIRRMEAWEKMKGIVSTSPPKPGRESMTASPPPRSPPMEAQPANTETVAEHLSESFSKTVKEWKRIQEKRVKKTPEPGSKGRSRRSERSKSGDRLPREKSRQRCEREIQKREQKLEKERHKLERMKLRLEAHDGKESVPLDFFKKLQEWDVIRNFKSDQLRDLLPGEHHARSRSEKYHRESISVPRERIMSDSSIAPTQLHRKSMGCALSGDESGLASPLVDDSTSIDLSVTMETIALLEDTNIKLSHELQVREDDLNCLQDDMQQLTDQMNTMNRDYTTEIEQYKKELWATSKIGRYNVENESVMTSLKELKQKLNQLQEFGERVMIEKRITESETIEQLRMRIAREEALLTQIEEVQTSLDKKAYIQGTEVFQKLYQYIYNVQKQVSSLKEGILERNSVIDKLQRHLLVQEVTNKLLASQLHQSDVTITYLKEQRKAGVLKRWKTFHGHDVIVGEDGMIGLRKKQPAIENEELNHVTNDIAKVTKDGLLDDRKEALGLHFDWLEAMQEQIQEVQDTQRFDIDIQTDDPDLAHSDAQTMMSLMNTQLPLSRVLWDGSLLPVYDKATQNNVATADAAVYIEDLEVYDLKQRGKWRRRKKMKEESPSPQRGTVFRRMEIFETSRSRELKAQRKLAATSKDSSMEDTDSKTVIGKKILDYEHSQNENKTLGSEDNSCDNDGEVVIIPNKTRSINSRDMSTSPDDPGLHFIFPGNARTLKPNTNLSHTERANYRKNNSDQNQNFAVSECIEASVSVPVASEVVLKTSDEHLDNGQTGSPYKDLLGAENVYRNLQKPPNLPLSPILHSKYARKLKPEESSPKQRKLLRHRKPSIERILQGVKKEDAADLKCDETELLEPMRSRARSESSVLTSKYGSDDIEEITAAKFTINVNKYMSRTRRDQAASEYVSGETLIDSIPFSRQNHFRKLPLGKLSITPVRNLKSAGELLGEPEESQNVTSEEMGDEAQVPGYTTPNSLPSASPLTARRGSSAQALKDITKRLSLPYIYVTDDLAGQGQSHSSYLSTYKYSSSPFTAVKGKAFVLEPFSVNVEKKSRPHSIISYSTETGDSSQTQDSVWKKLMGARSPKLARIKAATAPRNLGFKMFGKKKDRASTQGAVRKLCRQALSVETKPAATVDQLETDQNEVFDQPGTSFATEFRDIDSPESPMKKKNKTNFLDSKWLSKPKRFFKTSKKNHRVKNTSTDTCSEVEDNSGCQGLVGCHNNTTRAASEEATATNNAPIPIIHNELT